SRPGMRGAMARSSPRPRRNSPGGTCAMASWSEDARRFLEAHRVGHLATADAHGGPHVVPVCYALDHEALYFIADEKPKRRAARELKRLENLRENPRAARRFGFRSEEHTSELQSREKLVCRLLLEKKKAATADDSRNSC